MAGRTRRLKLKTLFDDVLKGERSIANSPKLFLEAVCDQSPAEISITSLAASPQGLKALLLAVSSDTSDSFLNGPLTTFLEFIKAPELRSVCSGSILRQIVKKLMEAPLMWPSLVQAVRDQTLEQRALSAFAWLLIQLLSLPAEEATVYLPVAKDAAIQRALMSSSDDIKALGKRIVRIADTLVGSLMPKQRKHAQQGPGGRHKNDFPEIHKIAIYPIREELELKKPKAYLPMASDVAQRAQESDGLALHIDAQFRLLRENMLRDLREELTAAEDPKNWRRKPLEIKKLTLHGVHCDERHPWSLQLACKDDLPNFKGLSPEKRKKLLKDNPKFLKHGFLVCVFVGKSFITLGTLVREEDLLINSPSILCIQIPGSDVQRALMELKHAGSNIRLLHVDTAIFTYEPVLKQLKRLRELSLAPEIVAWQAGTPVPPPEYHLSGILLDLLADLSKDHSFDLQSDLQLQKQTMLDEAQSKCFQAALQQRVVLLQGPPGTGKSFIGSLVGKAIYRFSNEKILVVCYTHHALDDFVEDLLNLGIPDHDIVRLGSTRKATPRTKALALKECGQGIKFTPEQWDICNTRKQDVTEHAENLSDTFSQFVNFKLRNRDLLEFLEFCEDDLRFYDAFKVPEEKNGMTRVGRGGGKIDECYLVERWLNGRDAGIFQSQMLRDCSTVWCMPYKKRDEKRRQWYHQMIQERLAQVREAGKLYNHTVDEVDAVFMEKDLKVMRLKRIIACTTTAAAKYSDLIRCIAPGVVLVEEAGEILESHVLTALGPDTKHLILIGDHKQLRPKVNYELSVEKGTGYDLNRSLFERLILKGFPYQTLYSQHRMRPEISALVREMTYPELEDAKETQGRPDLRGFTDNIIFVNHKESESEPSGTCKLGDSKGSASKQNLHEVKMTLKCVRYLAQQGYGTDDMVVLTPYLGQLRLLYDELKVDNDPVLNDLDCHDMVRAGLMPEATAQVSKSGLRVATVDNFQGEEAKIVIVSLCRSNIDNKIGFMSAPERLNVLISRARNAMILIGNAEHFMESRKGGDLWKRFIGLLKDGKHVYDGFPIRCDRHPDRRAILKKAADFDTECPDGGCKQQCDKMLNCGKHKCPDRCHMLVDHSKIKCKEVVSTKCDKGHENNRLCHAMDPDVCAECETEAKKAREEAARKAKAQKEAQQHLLAIAKLDQEIKAVQAALVRKKAAEQEAIAIEQKKKDLEVLKKNLMSYQAPNTPTTVANAAVPSPGPIQNAVSQPQTKSEPTPSSPAEKEWERQKRFEGASNDAIDDLMALTGLEAVKEKLLDIKLKIEVAKRQGIDISKERFSVTMVGNPGTGKTTVARIYGRFLAAVNAIPGSKFEEVSGSSLADDGVSGAKKKIEGLVGAGGGVFFLDEAYQLTSGNSHGGKAVLDYLLSEIENLRGTIVFILAGYKDDMEKFFEHNSGFASRVPHTFNFTDYSDAELLKMLGRMLKKDYRGQAELEDGPTGLYARILIRRQGRRRGSRNYGNARDLENTWACVKERQAKRIQRERLQGLSPDYFFFSKTDLIGREPSLEYLSKNSEAWQKLQDMIGLDSVKQEITVFLKRICLNYLRELAEEPLLEVSLNRLFLGSPGTGKTTVAKLYGEILAELDLLSKGEMIIKTPADFIGSVIGESEKNTKGILQASVGKVLVIDEAYGLSPAGGGIGQNSHTNIYKTAIIDTIVAEVQSTPGEDRCVLLLGYTDKMEEMLRNANDGLSRRFPLDSAFHFEDYDDEALRKILELKLKAQGLEASEEAKDVAIGVLARARDRPNFGNAGEVENLLSRAKNTWQKRQTAISDPKVVFGPEDFDEKHDRLQSSDSSIKELFSDIVGLDELTKNLESYQQMAVNLKARGKDPRELIPFTFVFKGPPGTGKTTVARRIAKFYYNIGILSTDEYTDCSAGDLVAQYVGQTAPLTREKLKSALGKVLFIDEAYRLQDSKFGKEAVDEIVDCLTKPDFMGKLVVILAGYTDDINSLLRVNPGLASRFPNEVFFESMQPERCITLLIRELLKKDVQVTSDVSEPESEGYRQILKLFSKLRELSTWGNGRDVLTLAKKIAGVAYQNANQSSKHVTVAAADILQAQVTMLTEQAARCRSKQSTNNALKEKFMQAAEPQFNANTPNVKATSSTMREAPPPVIEPPTPNQAQDSAGTKSPGQDSGVSDEVWQQLQRDIAAHEEEEKRVQAELQKQEEELARAKQEFEIALQQIKEAEERARAEAEEFRRQQELELARIQAIELKQAREAEERRLKEQREAEEYRRQQKLEKARIRAMELKRAQEAEERRLQKIREAQRRERQREQLAQKKLRHMGVCVQGFPWIKQSDGYRCAGGSHKVTNAQLGL